MDWTTYGFLKALGATAVAACRGPGQAAETASLEIDDPKFYRHSVTLNPSVACIPFRRVDPAWKRALRVEGVWRRNNFTGTPPNTGKIGMVSHADARPDDPAPLWSKMPRDVAAPQARRRSSRRDHVQGRAFLRDSASGSRQTKPAFSAPSVFVWADL